MTSGQSPPSSPRGFSGFCLAPRNRFKKFKGSKDIRLIRHIRGSIRTRPLAYGVAHHKKITTYFMMLGLLVVCLIMMHSVVGLYKLLWSTVHRTFGRPTRDAMVDRPKELWSTDQRPLE